MTGGACWTKLTARTPNEYWAEYTPPKLTQKDEVEAKRAGLVIAGDTVASTHLTYTKKWPVED